MSTRCDDGFERPINAERVMLMPPFNVVMAATPAERTRLASADAEAATATPGGER